MDTQTIGDANQIMTDLLNGYNKDVRPASNQADVLQVNVTYDIQGIQDVDEVAGTVTVSMSFVFEWIDLRMAWSPTLYNNTYTVVFPTDSVWSPELILSNPAGSITTLDSKWSSVRYYANGLGLWYPMAVYQVMCPINIKYFPFDTQKCGLTFLVNKYVSSELTLFAVNRVAPKNYFTDNGEWELTKTDAYVTNTGISIFNVALTMARRPAFVVIIVILPIIFLSALNIMVFILPPDSGERMSFTITILLALAVFLTIISDNIPKTSSPLSILCYFISLQCLLSTLICFVTLLNLRFFHKDDALVPTWVSSCVRRCQRRHSHNDYSSKMLNNSTNNKISDSVVANSELTSSEKKTLRCNDWNLESPKEQKEFKLTWRDISYYVDWIMFLISFVYMVICIIVFIFLFAFGDGSDA